MTLESVYLKLNNLFDKRERCDLSKSEEKELDNLKKLRNKLDPDWYKKV